MHTSQAFLDLLYIAKNDWIGNQLGQVVSAVRVIKMFRHEFTPKGEPGTDHTLTKELLAFKPKLGKRLYTPLPSFAERYSSPESREHLIVATSFDEILDDTQCKQFITTVESEFKKISKILEDYDNPEADMNFLQVAEQIENVYQEVQNYLAENLERIKSAEIIEPNEANKNLKNKPIITENLTARGEVSHRQYY